MIYKLIRSSSTRITLFAILISTCQAFGQGQIEVGYQQNFLQKGKAFADTKSYSGNIYAGYEGGRLPGYFMLGGQYIIINDEKLTANKYTAFLGGGKVGIRPLAAWLLFPIQPFVEGGYLYSLGKENPPLKSIWFYGGGLEIYFTKKHCLAACYGQENYTFSEASARLSNASGRVSLRIHF